MLSDREFQETQWRLNNIPSEMTGKRRQDLRQMLKKKLKEHRYASTYPPFIPSPHKIFFINYATTEKTIIHLMETIIMSNKFIVDTESISILYQQNVPALIQLQILIPHSIPYVLLIEVHHLPRTTTTTFTLIKELFNCLFNPEKFIYVWGSIDELKKFAIFGLFSENQICLINEMNLQDEFKIYWKLHHPHHSTTANGPKCLCEQCIGINPNNPWGLQDSVAYELNRWLDKRQTRSPFDIGLDKNLQHLNEKELEYRQTLIKYAVDDCLSMEQIMISMNLINIHGTSSETNEPFVVLEIQPSSPFDFFRNEEKFFLDEQQQSNFYNHEMESEEDDKEERKFSNGRKVFINTTAPSTVILEENIELSSIEQHAIPPFTHTHTDTPNWNSQSTNENRPIITNLPDSLTSTSTHRSTNNPNQNRPEISAEGKRKIHNRTCTLKQRDRNFKHKLVFHNINPRLGAKRIKAILKKNNIKSSTVNPVTSKETGETTLYVGIKDPALLKTYEEKTKNLFKNYQSRRPPPTSKNHHQINHHVNRQENNRGSHRINHREQEINNRNNYCEEANNRNNGRNYRRNYREGEDNSRRH